MMRTWTEFVLINAHQFKTGQYPWTDQEFWNNSQPQSSAPHTVDPIVISSDSKYFAEDARVAESDWWWTEGHMMWSAWPLPMGDDFKLTEDVVRFEFEPITTGTFDYDDETKGRPDPESMMTNVLREIGVADVFDDVSEIMRLFEKYSKGKVDLRIMTLWECSAGFDYIPGEPDEYDERWYLIGVVLPVKDGVKYEEI